MKKGLFFAAILFAVFLGGCQEEAEKKPEKEEKSQKCEPLPGQLGALHFCKLEHDWGTIRKGDSVFVWYPFKNVKDYPVTITEVMTSCECTIGEYPTEPIPPGGYGEIIGKFFSETQPPGRYEKILAVVVEGENFPFSIRLNGNVTE